jgi:hypothetical protein
MSSAEGGDVDDGEDCPKPPLAIDLMSGPNAPVAKALEWIGWEVMAFDIAISVDHDLRDTALQEDIREVAPDASCVVVGMDCRTYSRARERPIPGHPHAPRPLRSAAFPLGLPGLSGSDRDRVHDANALVEFFVALFYHRSCCWSRVRVGEPT